MADIKIDFCVAVTGTNVDNGEILELNIQAKGWRFVPLDARLLRAHMIHVTSGSGHAGEAVNQLKRRRWGRRSWRRRGR